MDTNRTINTANCSIPHPCSCYLTEPRATPPFIPAIVSRNSFNRTCFRLQPRIAQTRSQVSQLEESWNGTRFNLGQDSVRAASLGRWGRSRPLLVCFLFLPDAIPRPIKPRTGKENKLRNGILGNWYGIPINNSPYLSLNDVQLNAI